MDDPAVVEEECSTEGGHEVGPGVGLRLSRVADSMMSLAILSAEDRDPPKTNIKNVPNHLYLGEEMMGYE